MIPDEPFAHAKMLQWMFWEQYSHEPYIAVRRSQMLVLGRSPADLDPRLYERGSAALALMQGHLAMQPFMVGEGVTLADIALVAYTRVAHEGGFDLAGYPAIRAWIARVEAAFGISDGA